MDYTIYAAGFNKDAATEGTSINIKNNTGKAGKGTGAGNVSFEGVVVSGAQVDSKQMMENTYSALLKETDDIKSQIMASATSAKMSLKALFNRLNGSDAVRIDEDGFNLTDATPEEMVSILDKIKIELAAYCDSYEITGSGVSVDKIREVVGSTGFAEAVSGKMQDAGIPLTEDNVTEVAEALEQVKSLGAVSENAKYYLVGQGLEPTIENVYMAEHASGGREAALSEEDWQQLKPQIEKFMYQAGESFTERDAENAKAFLQKGIPVTVDNILYKRQLDDVVLDLEAMADNIVNNMASGGSAKAAFVTGEDNVVREVAGAISVLERAEYCHVEYATVQAQTDGGIVNLRSIEAAIVKFGTGENAAKTVAKELRAFLGSAYDADNSYYMGNAENISSTGNAAGVGNLVENNYQMMLEVQILMTADSGMYLARQGVSVMAEAISAIHRQLEVYGQETAMEDIAVSLAHDTAKAVAQIKYAPDVSIGAVLKDAQNVMVLSVSAFAQSGSSFRQAFKRASETYEAVGTSKRADMGDSVKKALDASTENILDSLELEDNKANRDAVRILAYNSMEMSEENITKVKELYQTLKKLIDNMTPDRCLEMIRNGVNPMSDDIHEVNEYLESMNAVSEKYSTFLYKLDRTEGITADEREQFIGIYKMFNMFRKDAGVAIGALCNQGADITMENLCAAYNSRRHSGMDYSVDDDTQLKVSATEAYYVSLFANTSTSITPLTLKNVQEEKRINSRSVEEFCETAQRFYDEESEAAYYNDMLEEMRHISEADDLVLRELARINEPVTLNNLDTCRQIMEAGLFNTLLGNGMGAKQKVNKFFDKLDNPAELEKVYEDWVLESEERLKGAVEGTGMIGGAQAVTDAEANVMAGEELDAASDGLYDSLKILMSQNRQIKMIANMSKRHDYNIPFMSDEGIGMMKLTLIQDENDKGRISLNYASGNYGKVSVEVKLSRQSLGIYGVCQTNEPEFAARLEEIAEAVKEEYFIGEMSVYCSKSEMVSRITYDGAENAMASEELYKIAKSIILNLV